MITILFLTMVQLDFESKDPENQNLVQIRAGNAERTPTRHAKNSNA